MYLTCLNCSTDNLDAIVGCYCKRLFVGSNDAIESLTPKKGRFRGHSKNVTPEGGKGQMGCDKVWQREGRGSSGTCDVRPFKRFL